jgi:hypothetical protein
VASANNNKFVAEAELRYEEQLQRFLKQVNIQGTFREHSGNIQGTFRERSVNIRK